MKYYCVGLLNIKEKLMSVIKVYCKKCLNCSSIFSKPKNCYALQNIEIVSIKNTWYSKEVEKRYIKKPEEINKNNDCKWYKEIK